jgi:D-arabinose 1-dehydrogenase-like Zn-dependent alcohol dehydrogenase
MQDAMDSLEMLARGIIRPPIAEHFTLDRVNEAMECVRGGKTHGRVVITVKE